MKLKRLKALKYNFLKTCLLIFENQNRSGITFDTEILESNFKYLLKVIYNFHYSHKKILFIVPKYLYENKYAFSIKSSSHYVFLKEAWVNGLICNRKYVLKHDTSVIGGFKNFKKLQSIDVVIIFDVTKKDKGLLNELNSLDVPIICCGITGQKHFNKKFSFLGCFQKVSSKSLEFFWFLIYLLIKR